MKPVALAPDSTLASVEQRIISTTLQIPGAFARFTELGLRSPEQLDSAAARGVFVAVRDHFASNDVANDAVPPEAALRMRLGEHSGWLDGFLYGSPYALEDDQTAAWRQLSQQRALRENASDIKLALTAAQQGETAEMLSRLESVKQRQLEASGSQRTGVAPSAILDRWFREGQLTRLSTGVDPLDRACRGGLPIPWRVVIVGAPSAGKTALQITIANNLARGGACVGILAVDEDPDDQVIRLAQMAGFTVEQAESRDPNVLAHIDDALKLLNLWLYDSSHTIESAGQDLATRARLLKLPGVLCIDSLQTVRSERQKNANTARELVEANVAAVRHVGTHYHLLVLATSEANRAAYRLRGSRADEQNDLAAGAESRAIEFSAQTQLVLRTPPDHPNIVHVRVAKNRRGLLGEFWLQLDREAHALREGAEPARGASRSDENLSAQDRALSARRDAIELSKLVDREPGLSARGLRNAVKSLRWGVRRLEQAKEYLREHGIDGRRLHDAGSGRASEWKLITSRDQEAE